MLVCELLTTQCVLCVWLFTLVVEVSLRVFGGGLCCFWGGFSRLPWVLPPSTFSYITTK